MKINVSMPDDIVRKLDEAAHENNSSRSALLTLAARRYLENKEEEKIQEDQRKASKEIDRIRESVEPWDATGEVLKWRDLH
jgi:metal-responsive CopG/Arc/MetJ family transcriptional regulator